MGTIAGTGHRPNKLGYEYDGVGVYSNAIRYAIQQHINTLKPDKIISGMALGFDQILAEVAITNKIPLVCAIPCANQEQMWPPKSRDRYNKIINWSKDHIINGIQQPSWSLVTVHMVSTQPYDNQCMQNRNIWMVDQLTGPEDKLLALSDGTGGGTMNCLKYANHKVGANKIIMMHPKTLLMEYDKHIKLTTTL